MTTGNKRSFTAIGNSRRLSLLAGAAAIIAGTATQAWAGFDWVPPLTISNAPVTGGPATAGMTSMPVAAPATLAAPVSPPPPVPSASAASSFAAQDLPPPPMDNAVAKPAAVVSGSGHEIIWNAAPVAPAAPALAETSPPAQTPEPLADDKQTVQGFGKDIPLALALHQIVPADYAFSFGAGVSPGTPVSWHGGAAWDKVLNDAVAPLGLQAEIDGHTVRVAASGSQPPMPAGAPVAARPAYTDDQLATIGANDDNYHPSYPRHHPHKEAAASTNQTAAAPKISWTSPPANLAADHPVSSPISESVPAQGSPPPAAVESSSLPVNLYKAPATSAGSTESQPPVAENFVPSPPPAATPLSTSPMASPSMAGDVPPPGTISSAQSLVDQDLASESKPLSLAPLHATNISLSTPEAITAPPPPPEVSIAPPANAPADHAGFDMQAVNSWQADKGDSLHDILSSWCQQAGVDLVWKASKDFKLPRSVTAEGTFPDALTKILTLYGHGRVRPVGELHPNLPDGTSVLIVKNAS